MSLCAALLGCGSGGGHPNFAAVSAGEMPSGESWNGVYYNPVYGYLHMTDQGGNIVGRWKRTDGSHWGELQGTVNGNVMHYTWTEHKYGAIGANMDTKGSGQFVFKMGQNKIPELDGQYAIEGSGDVGDWHCVKQMNLKPDLNSINGESPADTPASQDKWQ